MLPLSGDTQFDADNHAFPLGRWTKFGYLVDLIYLLLHVHICVCIAARSSCLIQSAVFHRAGLVGCCGAEQQMCLRACARAAWLRASLCRDGLRSYLVVLNTQPSPNLAVCLGAIHRRALRRAFFQLWSGPVS